jgi:hypothetical protein
MTLGLLIFGLIALLLVGWLKRLVLTAQLKKARSDYFTLREDYSAVRAANETLKQSYQDMRDIAAEAIKAAAEQHFPAQIPKVDETPGEVEKRIRSTARAQTDFVPPAVANCPRCAVSIRTETWPQQCPACRTLFNADGSLDTLEAASLE